MTGKRWQQIEELYHAALDHEAGKRQAFLRKACGGDEELYREVESLLASHQAAQNFMPKSALVTAAKQIASEEILDLLGRRIGRYHILRFLGAGGMGDVYLAADTLLNRRVALKFLPATLQGSKWAGKPSLSEAQTAAALDHPFLCHIHEVGEADGRSFIAMEYVQGRTLKDRLKEGAFPLQQAVRIAAEIAEALQALHGEQLVHRDLKPSNIILTSNGHAKVMDFGLAERLRPKDSKQRDGNFPTTSGETRMAA